MAPKVTQEQFNEIVNASYILPDEEMTQEFRQFLSDYGIEVRVRNGNLLNFDYLFYTKDLHVIALSVNPKAGGKSAIQLIKHLFAL